MESLPPFDWHQLATKKDLSVLEGKIEANKAAIEASEQRLCTEMDGKFAKVDAEFKMIRAENKEFRGEMALQFAKQTRTMVFTMLVCRCRPGARSWPWAWADAAWAVMVIPRT